MSTVQLASQGQFSAAWDMVIPSAVGLKVSRCLAAPGPCLAGRLVAGGVSDAAGTSIRACGRMFVADLTGVDPDLANRLVKLLRSFVLAYLFETPGFMQPDKHLAIATAMGVLTGKSAQAQTDAVVQMMTDRLTSGESILNVLHVHRLDEAGRMVTQEIACGWPVDLEVFNAYADKMAKPQHAPVETAAKGDVQ